MDTAYDEVPYQNLPFTQALPRGHATIATLHGLTPPDPSPRARARVGVWRRRASGRHRRRPPRGRGGRPSTSPASAVDLARATAAGAGLENVRFEVGDVVDLTEGQLGEFDYVIVHGLYAWVPRAGARGGARGVPLPPRARRDRVRLLQLAPRRPPAPHAARDGRVPRARARRPARAGGAGARPVHAARPVRRGRWQRCSTRGCWARRCTRSRKAPDSAARPRPARARRMRPCGFATSWRRPGGTGSPTSATRSRRPAARRRGRTPSRRSSPTPRATTGSRASSTST